MEGGLWDKITTGKLQSHDVEFKGYLVLYTLHPSFLLCITKRVSSNLVWKIHINFCIKMFVYLGYLIFLTHLRGSGRRDQKLFDVISWNPCPSVNVRLGLSASCSLTPRSVHETCLSRSPLSSPLRIPVTPKRIREVSVTSLEYTEICPPY